MKPKVRMIESEKVSDYIGVWFCDDGTIVERATGKFLPIYANGGVRLRDRSNVMKNVQAHRMIAMAFVPNPKNDRVLTFKNGDKTDRRADNLAWSRSGKVLSQQTQDILAMYTMGRTSVEIAYHFRVTPQYVNRLLKDFRD